MGILYIVATPIGNLKDITLRALEVLKGVDLIVCEDTRQTLKLLNHYNIQKPLVSYFQHSRLSKIEYIVEQLAQGKNVALVTDAGTPGISDPGGKLISQLISSSVRQFETEKLIGREATETNKLIITPIPGPNAAIAALSVSGFPADRFIFMGFPPHKKGREKFFKEVAEAKYTIVFYESTHRVLKTLKELSLRGVPPSGTTKQSRGEQLSSDGIAALPSTFRERCWVARNDKKQIVVCRELTKQFESIYRGSAEEIIKILESDRNNQKGEFVVIVEK